MRRLRVCGIIVVCLLLAVPALAQSRPANEPHLWLALLISGKSLIWLAVAALFCYVSSCVLASLFTRLGYPPIVARLAVWAGAMLWVMYVAFIQCRYVVAAALPLWFECSLVGLGLVFGMILWFTRSTALE